MVSPVWADDDKPADTPNAQAEKDAPEAPEEVDPFKVPDGTPDELVDYIQQLRKARPEGRDRASLIKFMKSAGTAMVEAADKIIASPDATNPQISIAVQTKMQGIMVLMRIGSPKGLDMLKSFHEQLLKLKRPELAKKVEGQILGIEVGKAARTKKDLDEVLKKVEAYVGDTIDGSSAQVVMQTVSTLGYVDKKKAFEVCEKYAPLFAKSDNESVVKMGKTLEGTGRRMDLPGHTMKIVGKKVDGSDFDWSAYKGKVVLVQFWATWCGPCRGEIPGILEDYKKYHDKGFEVVGISLDRSLEALEKYIEKEELPWTVIYNGAREEGEERGEMPNTTYYGIRGIPEIILVGRDGKVIATGLRGKKITAALEKIFGPAEEKSEDDTAEAPEK